MFVKKIRKICGRACISSDREVKNYDAYSSGKKFMQVLKAMATTKVKERIEAVEHIPTKSAGLILNQGTIATNAKVK